MLVKIHLKKWSDEHDYLHEDMGILSKDGRSVHMMNWGIQLMNPKVSKAMSPVRLVNWLWMEKPIYVKCGVAATRKSKTRGLEGKNLRPREGLYFPYPERAKVAFHQAGVQFPLDVIFLRDNAIVKLEQNTKVGSKNLWTCNKCDGVIEVHAGFVDTNDIAVGDRLTFFATSDRDLRSYETDRAAIEAETRRDRIFGEVAHRLGFDYAL
jgi:uncharacterized membrane protein (UPF0127 family)